MNRSLLLLPLAVLGITAAAADPARERLTNQELLFNDQPILTADETAQAVDRGLLNCQTDELTGSHIDKMTVCELAQVPLPTGSRYRFILTQEGLHPMFCSSTAGCVLPPSVASNLSSLQHVHVQTY